MSIGFDRDCDRREGEIMNQATRGKLHVWILLTDILGVAERQESVPNGLGSKSILKRNKYLDVSSRICAAHAQVVIRDFSLLLI